MRRKQVAIEDQLTALQALDAPALRAKWAELFGTPPPPRFRRDFLMRAVAYRMQEVAYGGLKPATARELKRIAAALRDGAAVTPRVTANPGKGTRFMREWNGETHIVERVTSGYAWRGKMYPSLSGVARAITGTSWSGPAFFGLKAKRKPRMASGDDLSASLGPALLP